MTQENFDQMLADAGSKKTLRDLVFEELARVVTPGKPLPCEADAEKTRESTRSYFLTRGVSQSEVDEITDLSMQNHLDVTRVRELEEYRREYLLLLRLGHSPTEARSLADARVRVAKKQAA